MKRYLIVLIGTSKGIGEDLNHIADDRGIHFVDGKGLFLGTFYSELETGEIHELLAHRPAFLLFDISSPETNGINLPAKYYTGLFPETKDMTDILGSVMVEEDTEISTKTKKDGVEEYDSVNDILDKLSRNNYDRTCLTEKEVKILSGE
jgi:hypothetical protein